MRQNFWGWMGRLARELWRERDFVLTVIALALFVAALAGCLGGCSDLHRLSGK